MAKKFFDAGAAAEYVDDEIRSFGTSSMFLGRGLDPETGEYDADKIAKAIKRGRFPKLQKRFMVEFD